MKVLHKLHEVLPNMTAIKLLWAVCFTTCIKKEIPMPSNSSNSSVQQKRAFLENTSILHLFQMENYKKTKTSSPLTKDMYNL